jgi:Flp pilus assembly pilin Flp
MSSKFKDDENGGVAIEFSILALPFFLLIFATLSLVYHALVQSELDRAITSIAADIALRAPDATTSTVYLSNGACSEFVGPLLDCDQIRLGAGIVAGRLISYKDTVFGSSAWNLGCAGDTVILELTYPYAELITPVVIADLIDQGGQTYYRSRAVVRREPVVTGAAAC